MPLKFHLLVVCCIVVIVYLAWQLTNTAPVPAAKIETEISPYHLSISHASWGLACRNIRVMNNNTPHDAFAENTGNEKIYQDNVLTTVSQLCNGKQKCEIPVDPTVLGEDPMPDCHPKAVEIEYRCFSYDRPWLIKASSGIISLHCDTPSQNK